MTVLVEYNLKVYYRCCSFKGILMHLLICFPSLEECRNIILQYGVREVTASQVARVLGMMARTHSGLSDGIGLQVCCC